MLQDLVGGALGGIVSWTVLLGFFGKSLLGQLLKKELKEFEAQLATKAEVLKTQLTLYAHQQTVAISRIDLQRADAIKDIFAGIATWNKVITMFKHPDRYLIAKEGIDKYFGNLRKNLFSSLEELSDTMVNNAIYLSSETYDRITEVHRRLVLYSHEIDNLVLEAFHSGIMNENEICNTILQSVSKCSETHLSEIDPIRGQLVDEFRKLMGAQ